jgi:hypothetical protein
LACASYCFARLRSNPVRYFDCDPNLQSGSNQRLQTTGSCRPGSG